MQRLKPQGFRQLVKKYLSTSSLPRAICVNSKEIQPSTKHASPSFSHVDASNAPQQDKFMEKLRIDKDANDRPSPFPYQFHPNSALVYPNFISDSEASSLESDVMKRMRRKRFEKGHWDAVIKDYKEVELMMSSQGQETQHPVAHNRQHAMSQVSAEAIRRVRDHISKTHFFPSSLHGVSNEEDETKTLQWINCHAIHLKKEGLLTSHVDSIKFSGDIVAGVSLLSSSIMRLRPASPSELAGTAIVEEVDDARNLKEAGEADNDNTENDRSKSIMDAGYVDLFLPPRSLYVLSGVSRYMYTHEILPCNSQFKFGDDCDDRDGTDLQSVKRDDRISIMFRDAV
jgi:alkylated DNA repair protein alkB family protein 7